LNWAIGDIQGCFDSLSKILKEINFNPNKDKLWLVGDLVNRGDKSLEVLEYLYSIKDSVNIVLGNHDITLISAYYGLKKSNPTIDPILASPNANMLIDWLRSKPFMHIDFHLGYVMAHAGIAPNFDLGRAIYYNTLLQKNLSGENAKEWLEKILNKETNKYHPNSDIIDEQRYALNSFIRMRYCYIDGTLDFKQKGSPKDLDNPLLYPWFECPNYIEKDLKIVFGHWSTLGYLNNNRVLALDTGCLWGRKLSAYCLESNQLIQISCQQMQKPSL